MAKSESKRSSKKVLIALVAFIILLVGGVVIVGATFKKTPFFSSDTEVAPQEKEAEELIEKVGELIVLPEGRPTIATVSDKNQLIGQPFFVNAENGDKVLIYTESKKAILYRPSIDKVVEVGPVVEQQSSPSVSPSPSPSPTEVED